MAALQHSLAVPATGTDLAAQAAVKMVTDRAGPSVRELETVIALADQAMENAPAGLAMAIALGGPMAIIGPIAFPTGTADKTGATIVGAM